MYTIRSGDGVYVMILVATRLVACWVLGVASCVIPATITGSARAATQLSISVAQGKVNPTAVLTYLVMHSNRSGSFNVTHHVTGYYPDDGTSSTASGVGDFSFTQKQMRVRGTLTITPRRNSGKPSTFSEEYRVVRGRGVERSSDHPAWVCDNDAQLYVSSLLPLAGEPWLRNSAVTNLGMRRIRGTYAWLIQTRGIGKSGGIDQSVTEWDYVARRGARYQLLREVITKSYRVPGSGSERWVNDYSHYGERLYVTLPRACQPAPVPPKP